jgi:hypothetical protein
MFRTAIALFALAASTPAFTDHYQAQPSAVPGLARFVTKDVVWNCAGGGCTAGKSNSRPAIVCAALVRQIGPVSSFAAGGEALAPDQLEKCNARAR